MSAINSICSPISDLTIITRHGLLHVRCSWIYLFASFSIICIFSINLVISIDTTDIIDRLSSILIAPWNVNLSLLNIIVKSHTSLRAQYDLVSFPVSLWLLVQIHLTHTNFYTLTIFLIVIVTLNRTEIVCNLFQFPWASIELLAPFWHLLVSSRYLTHLFIFN